MTPGDVMEEVIGMHDPSVRLPAPDNTLAMFVWGRLCEGLKSDDLQHMPLSPEEVTRAEVILDAIRAAVRRAKARKPGHFRPVEEGGR